MTEAENIKATESLFAGGGEMGALMRSHDWSQTPLGAVEQWSQSLKTAVRIMLTSRQPMFVWWGEELINLYNDAYQAIVGGKHPQALGQPASQVWREIWDQVGPRAESATLRNEGTYDEALLLIMERNGYPEETYYTFSYSPVPDDQGNTGGIICANSDDTQRIINERQLTLLRELAAKTADARTFDQACKLSTSCLETNPYDLPFAAIYLVDPEQQCFSLTGTCGIEPDHPAVPATVAFDADSIWSLAEALETHQACLISNLAATFDNLPTGAWQRSPHQAVVLPIAPSGQTGRSGILVVGLNPFRLFDDNYRRFIDLVAAQISASIANANAYEEERKRAEALAELDRAKTTFFSNVSHEFRTPLTLMLSPLADTLANANGALLPQQREALELVHRNGLRLLKLVNTLLDFSRIEAGRVQAVYEPTDLATFTAELASMFRSAIERAGLHLAIDCPPLPELVYVDRDMWEKIVLNLLSNAFKFTFEGEIAVGLHVVGNRVELVVRDTGMGIPAAELPRLFERFYRVSGSNSRTHEGSGIGLSLVQELVKLHGGTVDVSSTIEQGTTFTVTIPLGYAHLPSERIRASRTLQSTALGAAPFVEEALRWLPAKAAGEEIILDSPLPLYPVAPQHPATPARILLADDNTDMRDYVKRLLSQSYNVEAVEDGIAALEAIAQQMPDLVLTDVMMPRLDGFGLLRELRATSSTQELPIILLSARAGEESRVEGLEAGADDYLIKPFSARELLARVEANLKLAQLRQAAAQQERVLRVEAQTAQANLESVLSEINDQFLVLDREWRYTYVNDRVVEITGKQKQELLGKSVWELFPQTVDTQFYTEVHRAVAWQQPVQFEYFYSPWQRWFENRVYPGENGVTIFVAEITDRKQAEKALRKSEERFRQMAETIQDVFWITDFRVPQILYVSPAYEQIWGRCREELYHNYSVWGETLHPDDRERVQAIAASCQDQDIVENEYRIVRPDGSIRWIRDRGFALRDETGQTYQVVGVAQDITKNKQAEAALLESENRFRLATRAVDALVFDWDLQADEVYRSEKLYPLVGVRPEDAPLTSEWWRDRIHPDDLARLQPQMPNLLASPNNLYDSEYRVRHEDGHWVDVWERGCLIRDQNGQVIRIVGSTADITSRKQAEATLRDAYGALRDRETRLRLIVESAKDYAIFTLDMAGQITSWNSGAQRLLGYEEAEIVGQHGRMIFTPEDIVLGKPEAEMRTALTQGRAENERWHVCKDGSRFWGSGLAMPLRDAADQIQGFLKIMQDKTEQRQAQQEREQLLAREQTAREQAETANRIKDEFLAVLSHELRTPLNPILGWSRLLRHSKLDAKKTAHALETIERNAKLQTQLIEDLLDVSRILRGKLSLNIVPVNLVSTIESAIETVRLAAEAKAIQIQTVFDPTVGQILGDSARLQQVIWNLLSNAVKFTPAGGQVNIRLERRGTQAQIQVSDTGKGIPPDFLPHVFEYFRQADGTTTRRFGGLGLGLAIVRHLVELHGGTVQAASQGEGQGATFTVQLPIMKVDNGMSAAEAPALLTDSSHPLQGIRVLVVDDEADTRDLVTFIIKEAGAIVTAVASAIAALEACAQAQPDVLVSDIGMPEMDGYMLIRQLRSQPQGQQILAIALTAYAGEIDYRQALAAGFQQHIPKPVEPVQLIEAIASVRSHPSNQQ